MQFQKKTLNFTDVSIFCFAKKSAFLVKNSTFTQSNNVRDVLESSFFSFC